MKQKTKSAADKRFKASATGKIQRRRVGQAHFNARATGNEIRRKHREQSVDTSDSGRISRLLPYAQS